MYILKLHHLLNLRQFTPEVQVRIHLVAQQPLGGKTPFVGNVLGKWKFGHWKHTVLHILCRKSLTVKSDDIVGRVKTCKQSSGAGIPRTEESRIL